MNPGNLSPAVPGLVRLVVLVLAGCHLAWGSIPAVGPLTMKHSRLQSNEEIAVIGPVRLTDVHAPTLDITGPLEFQDLVVAGSARVTGPVKGKKGTFNTLDVTGPLNIRHLKAESANITGPVHVHGGHVGDLTVTAETVMLENVTAASVLIHPNGDKPQTLHLKGQTVIQGNITFESGQGRILQDSSARIHGAVSGLSAPLP